MSDTRSLELRRIRSAGDVPLQSNRIAARESKEAISNTLSVSPSLDRGPQSAGPSFSHPGSPEPVIIERPDEHSSSEDATHALDSPPPVIVVDHSPQQQVEPPSTPDMIPPNNVLRQRPPPRQHNRSLYSRTMGFFGYGRDASRARRSLVSLIWNLAWGFVQIVVVIAIIGVSTSFNSRTDPGLNEWQACDRPLGVWSCLWIVRVLFACLLTHWGYQRDRATQANRPADAEANAHGTHSPATPPRGGPQTAGTPSPTTRTNALASNTHHPSGSTSTSDSAPILPHTRSYRRLSLFSSLFSLSWFLTAHILEYTSINTCRISSPHLWWLVFGILCITYLMVLEVIILGFIVFIVAPILFLFWNIFLMCIGRHPVQNPHMIRPDIGKLPKSVVDSIPLVMYIPPPPDVPQPQGPIQVPDAVYSYPPKTPSLHTPSRRRFRFIRRPLLRNKKASNSPSDPSNESSKGKMPVKSGEPQTWEEHWELEGYPFVVLEGNRAACAICLMDFEEPKRADGVSPEKDAEEYRSVILMKAGDNIIEEGRDDRLRLEDAGEGAQPLRLLQCGHVFHKTCLDPWLIDVSGRCPVCQRPVEVPEAERKRKSRRR